MEFYSEDFRKIVVLQVKLKKYKRKEISDMYGVSLKTLYRWTKSYDETRSFSRKEGYQKGYSHVITDLEGFKKIVAEENFATAEEIVSHIKRGSASSIARALKKINFVKKKAQKKYLEHDSAKVSEYLNLIKDKDSSKFVYVDETGFEKKVLKSTSICRKELKKR